jgi:polyketide cyclase/dehydrase/lipid transport protein
MGSSFEVTRATTIQADPARVHGLVNDFREWTAWSPWEDLDPELERTYSDPSSGVGAHYAWKGNRKAGEGSMEITGSGADRVEIELAFLKPMRNTQLVEFVMTPVGAGTDVTWRMSGQHEGVLMNLFSKVVSMDKLIGKDFEKGLARLKAVAEAP